MKNHAKIFLMLLFTVNILSAGEAPGEASNIFVKAARVTARFAIDNLTSPTAIDIYKKITISVGTHIIINMINPFDHWLQIKTNSEGSQEKNIRLALIQKELELKETEYGYEKAKSEDLDDRWPRIQQILARKQERIKASDLPQEEKSAQLEALKKHEAWLESTKDDEILHSYSTQIAAAAAIAQKNPLALKNRARPASPSMQEHAG